LSKKVKKCVNAARNRLGPHKHRG